MSELESAGVAVQQSLKGLNKKFQKKLVTHKIFHCWKDIAGVIADDIFPIKIVGKTIVLYAKTSAAKDNFKYIARDILDAANKVVGGEEEIYKKFDFAKSFTQPQEVEKNIPDAKNKKIPVAKVKLSAAELAECENNVAEVKNPELKKIALESFIAQKKSNKLKIKAGWHKCKCCDSLCPPEEIICDSCRISERDKMRRTIRQIFTKNPEKNFPTVFAEVKKIFPHIAEEISVTVVSSERSALINSTAAKVAVGDTKSDAAKFLVQLYKQLPKEKLTDAVINRALKELRFNLANQPPFKK